MMQHLYSDILWEKAKQLCAGYLSGTWAEVQPKDILISKLKGGLLNQLFKCSLPNTIKLGPTVPRHVLVRFFGGNLAESSFKPSDESSENLAFYILSQHDLGPKLYGAFTGGRIEEFIESRLVSLEEFARPDVNAILAKKMAKFHSMDMPLEKRDNWTLELMDIAYKSYINQDPLIKFASEIPTDQTHLAETLLNYDFGVEVEWLKTVVPKIPSKKVFCHGDVHRGNVLIKNSNDILENRIVMIDIDMCGYNYRACDFACYFVERCFDFTDLQKLLVGLEYPNEEEQMNFFSEYLKEFKLIQSTKIDEELDTPEHLILETYVYSLPWFLIVLHWLLKSFAGGQTIPYLGFAAKCLSMYQNQKLTVIEKYPFFANLG